LKFHYKNRCYFVILILYFTGSFRSISTDKSESNYFGWSCSIQFKNPQSLGEVASGSARVNGTQARDYCPICYSKYHGLGFIIYSEKVLKLVYKTQPF